MSIDLIKLSQEKSLDSWRDLFDNSIPELEDIQDLINGKLKCANPTFPLPEDIFNAFKFTPPENVNVVIVGQDPYVDIDPLSKLPRATGLAFSSRGNTLPPSLKNIFDEVKRNYPECEGKIVNGDLTSWAQQGVLLLNMTLTVTKGDCNSHKGIWQGFITKTIDQIEKVNKNCIYVLWGSDAIEIERKMNLKGKILKATHPGPNSYNKDSRAAKKFEGCRHFLKINKLLEMQNKKPIEWC